MAIKAARASLLRILISRLVFRSSRYPFRFLIVEIAQSVSAQYQLSLFSDTVVFVTASGHIFYGHRPSFRVVGTDGKRRIIRDFSKAFFIVFLPYFFLWYEQNFNAFFSLFFCGIFSSFFIRFSTAFRTSFWEYFFARFSPVFPLAFLLLFEQALRLWF